MSHLNASHIAAQAAMSSNSSSNTNSNSPQHMRKRSMTIPDPNHAMSKGHRILSSPPPLPTFNIPNNHRARYDDGFSGGHKLAAATAATSAANVAFPQSPRHSPIHAPPDPHSAISALPPALNAPQEREVKQVKEKSKMKLFSKPKSIGITKDKDKDKDLDKKHPPPSPNKIAAHSTVTLPRFANASMTSLVDPSLSSTSTLYASANVSTSTLVPTDQTKERDKHKHNLFSRQKNKLKDDHHLPLSSASSTSRPTDPNAPQPLYSFATPSSPGHSSSFTKTMSGLDLRHGGRALREKKKEEKAAAASLLAPTVSSSASVFSEATHRERDPSFSGDREWPGHGLATMAAISHSSTTIAGIQSDVAISHPQVQQLAHAFSMPGLGPDDAWPLLKARLLHVFEGDEPRQTIEDFNALVGVWIRRCVQQGRATVVIEDLNELLRTGFGSLDQTLRSVPDDKLVPALVDVWHQVFSTMLPFLQAVFLPLDLEFKGRGSIMNAREAAEKWGAKLPQAMDRSFSRDKADFGIAREPSPEIDTSNAPTMGEDLDVRRMTLLTYRDVVILPRIDSLLSIFSRLSLENLSAGFASESSPLPSPPSLAALVTIPVLGGGSGSRPGTAASVDPSTGSYGSSSHSGGGVLTDASLSSLGARSRATSNTSAGSFQSLPNFHTTHTTHSPHTPSTYPAQTPTVREAPMDSAQVTQIVGRMLQCVSVLAGVQTGDKSQEAMERLAREMKLNWLGRGRTGRQRRGFVGTRTPRLAVGRGAVGAGAGAGGGGGIQVK